jgi:patatin-like phospholipase/acyl hydrolase
MNNSKYKLLIIVGGGVYGIIPAAFLSMLPEEYQKPNNIDGLAGCSIGGILTAAYAAGYDYKTVFSYFRTHVADCFDRRLAARLNPLACPTYTTEGIDTVIDKLLGGLRVHETRQLYPNLDIFIPGLNITDDKYKVWDNIDAQDSDVLLADIAKVTSAAPSYFDGRELHGKCYIDGGLIEVAPLITASTSIKAKNIMERRLFSHQPK